MQRVGSPLFKGTMRIAPSVTVTSAGAHNATGQAAVNINEYGFGVTTTALALGGFSLDSQWTADAEL